MHAISTRQPFADFILRPPPERAKSVENRTRAIGLKAGEWVWLHAGRAFFFGRREWMNRARRYREEILAGSWPDMPVELSDFTRGAIIGAIRIEGVYDLETYNRRWPGDPWAHGPVCYRIGARVALENPVPCMGFLGRFDPLAHNPSGLKLGFKLEHGLSDVLHTLHGFTDLERAELAALVTTSNH